MEKKEIIYYREKNWQSIVADTYMFLMLVSAMAINHFYLGDSGAWAVILFLFVLATIVGRANSKRERFSSKEEIIEYLNNHKTL